ncbi:MAG: hypothetical protein Q8P76_01760 [bacterium]|nr:hypothetical protein [bacterium]
MILGAMAIALGLWMALSIREEKKRDVFAVAAYIFAYLVPLSCFLVGVLAISEAMNTSAKKPELTPNHKSTVAEKSVNRPTPASPDQVVRRITINYDAPVEWLIENGNYAWRNRLISSKNFPNYRTGLQTAEIHIISFSRTISTGEVFKEMFLLGLLPASAHELLTLKLRHPDLIVSKTLVALGSYYQREENRILVPAIYLENDLAILSLRPENIRWTADYCFVAIKE